MPVGPRHTRPPWHAARVSKHPAAWETNAPAPFLVLEREHGSVEVWGLGADRFTVRAPDREQLVAGFTEAREMARALAEALDVGR
jgi:hypothetical protein